MPVRASMAELIAHLRLLIGDKNAPQQFTDQEIQDQLDKRRDVVRYAPLRPEPTPAPNTGVIQYLNYYGTLGFWEADAQLFGPAWQPLTPDIADFITGHWTFASSLVPNIYIVGTIYDVYGVAADLLESWTAADVLNSFDVRTGERDYRRYQKSQIRMQIAASYRSKSWAEVVTLNRTDAWPDYGGIPIVSDRIR